MSDKTSKISIIIVTYQSRRTIGETLDSIVNSCDYCLSDKVIVIDNASNDGTPDFIEQQYPWVTLIRNKFNIGFGRACNYGIDYAKTKYVFFINPDATLDPNALSILIKFMDKNSDVGICGPSVIEASGALQPSGATQSPLSIILKPLFPALASRDQRYVIPGEAPRRTNWICGSIMLIRKRVFDKIGGFDPRFFLYFEEADLCYRAQMAGWKVWTVGEAVCTHVNAASAKTTRAPMIWGTISEHYFKSRFYYMIKHYGYPVAILTEIGELLSMFLRGGIDFLRGKKYQNLMLRLRSPILKLPDRVQVK